MTNQPPSISRYLTVGETALIVRMTPQWVYGAIKRGEFEGVVRNGAVKGLRIPEASVYSYLARKSSALSNAA